MEKAIGTKMAVCCIYVFSAAILLLSPPFSFVAFAEEENEISIDEEGEGAAINQGAEGGVAEFPEQENLNPQKNPVQITMEMKMAFYIFIAMVIFGSFAARKGPTQRPKVKSTSISKEYDGDLDT